MKKCVIALLCFGAFIMGSFFEVKAEEYQNYQEIVFDDDEAKLLKDFSDQEYEDALKLIKKKRFIGWKIEVVNEEQVLEFVSETKLKIYNNGYSTIKHDITLETEEETKFQLSASGSIKVGGKGDVKQFSGSVDADIKASVSYSSVKTQNEKYEFEIIVDPLTYVKIITRGEGIINNGVGKYYFFWINTKDGGWETFTLTTEYYEIIKERIG
ncbi:MAG: hypothetical protein JXB08_04585 [Bacilli bacterium]|nr:hypothetical protein [Bacilli bacterium]MBN2877381.1 hypothetical protein [Bacilli bacterium]